MNFTAMAAQRVPVPVCKLRSCFSSIANPGNCHDTASRRVWSCSRID